MFNMMTVWDRKVLKTQIEPLGDVPIRRLRESAAAEIYKMISLHRLIFLKLLSV